MTETYCGYIALLGRPNAGKSTLLNACLGQKIVGVSKRPQTTRNRILGIDTQDEHQLIFLDSPGLHQSTGLARINKTMNRIAWSVAAEADLICYLIDSVQGWHEEDRTYLQNLLKHTSTPILVLATKNDAAKNKQIEEQIKLITENIEHINTQTAQEHKIISKPFAVSAKRKESVQAFKAKIGSYMPAGEWLFDRDELTDQPERFVVSELIREQLFRHLGAELPYGCGVYCESITTGPLVSIKATIVVTRLAHKPIVIGKQGSLLKTIGTKARLSLETHFGTKVYLELYVKVDKDWINDPELLASYQNMQEPL